MATSKKKKWADRQTLLAKWMFFASSVPAHPRILLMAAEKLQDRFSGAADLERTLSLDPSLCLRVMRMAGSVAYRGQTPTTPGQAIMRIGFERITDVVNHLFNRRSPVLSYSLVGMDLFDDLWTHSVLTGLAAVELKKRAGGVTAEGLARVRWLGLIHDLGRLVFLAGDHERYSTIVRGAIRGHLGSPSREYKEFHLTHADLGGEIADRWNLGREAGWVLSSHHVPGRAPREYWTVPLVHLADWVALKVQEDWTPDMKEPDRQAARVLGLKPADLRLAIAATARSWDETRDFMEAILPLQQG